MKKICVLLLVLGVISGICILTSQDVFAFVQLDAEAKIDNVSFVPSIGEIQYSGIGDSISVVSNSLGEFINNSMFTVPVATSSATVTFASVLGLSDATGEISSEVHGLIPDAITASAGAVSINLIWPTFLISGGTGSVDVTVSFDYSHRLHGIADQFGDFWGDATIGFSIYDSITGDVIRSVELLDEEISGVDVEIINEFSGTNTDTVSLLFDTQYGASFWAFSDLEINNVPEPATILLLGFGLAGVGLFRKRFKN